MTRLLQKLQVQEARSLNPYKTRVQELSHLPANERIIAIEADLKSLPKEVSDKNVFHHKTLLRLWDAARIEAGVATPAEIQRENSPVTYEQMADARLVFRPRFRA